MLKRISILTLCLALVWPVVCQADDVKNSNDELGITAKSAVLMEVSTGKIIYRKNSDEELCPASITKIMTLILIFDKLEEGKIMLDDFVTTSEYAKSMGGSQVFLEEGEKQTVNTLIKCIVVASGNDACVTMAEYIAGNEQKFVELMNEKAKKLEMNNTHFVDCSGLTDSDNHYTTAADVAKMSCYLLKKYPQIKNYSTIWMDTITHVTKKGNSEFGLSNTNKLLKMNCNYKVTGLKTGSTSKAKYCLSASAEKDGLELVAVIMAAPDYKVRFSQAQTLLNFGYANCTKYTDNEEIAPKKIEVAGGISGKVGIQRRQEFSFILSGKDGKDSITKKISVPSKISAPIKKGEVVGEISYYLKDKEIGKIDIVANETVKKAEFKDYIYKIFVKILL